MNETERKAAWTALVAAMLGGEFARTQQGSNSITELPELVAKIADQVMRERDRRFPEPPRPAERV